MTSIDHGMQIDAIDEQHMNASLSIRASFDAASTVTFERLWHPQKHFAERTSTQEGMQTEESREQFSNADDPI
jgi:hypothetical protein